MIFVTVGTQRFPFERLLRQADALAAEGTDEPVFAQTGHCTYIPTHCGHQSFLSKAEFAKKIEEASCVVTHSGVGTIIAALKRNKPVVVVPRLRRYGEHVDDHQLDIAQAFAQKGIVLVCGEGASLPRLVKKSRSFVFQKYQSQQQRLLDTISGYLERVEQI